MPIIPWGFVGILTCKHKLNLTMSKIARITVFMKFKRTLLILLARNLKIFKKKIFHCNISIYKWHAMQGEN